MRSNEPNPTPSNWLNHHETSAVEEENPPNILDIICNDSTLNSINSESPVVKIGDNIIYDHDSVSRLHNSLEEFKNETRTVLNKILHNQIIIIQYITGDKGIDFLDKLNPMNGLKTKDLNIPIASIDEFDKYMDVRTANSTVRKNTLILLRPDNVNIEVSKSEKLTSNCNGHCPEAAKSVKSADKEVDVMIIPKGTTGNIQPLDMFGFRMWKNFVKHFSDSVLIHAPRYVNLFRYSWFKSGYTVVKSDTYGNPVKFVFRDDCKVFIATFQNVRIL
ncbi:hypothetical protein PV325_010932 [Microctonus aethiopoides]|nr:hypothetical protein PV325_010932 [Microctonus aethiopoides]